MQMKGLMKARRHKFLVSLTTLAALLLVLSSCEPQGPGFELTHELSFRVSGINSELTKSTQDEEVVRRIPLSGDCITAGGDTLFLRISETSITDVLAQETPATKGVPFSGITYPVDKSFGLIVRTYETSGGEVESEWAVYPPTTDSNPKSIRTDKDVSRSEHSSKWVPTPRLRWPGGNGYVRFFAYAPFTDDDVNKIDDLIDDSYLSVSGNNAFPKLSYTVPQQIDKQVDLLVAASREFEADPDIDDIDVALAFQHALTGIRFRVGSGLSLKSVKVEKVKNSGSLILSSSAISWSDLSGEADYSLTSPALTSDAHDRAYKLTGGAQTLLLMPQTLGENAKIIAEVEASFNGSNIPYKVEASIAGNEWKPGKMVTYTITDTDITYYIDVLKLSDPEDATSPLVSADWLIYQNSATNNEVETPIWIKSYSSLNIGGRHYDPANPGDPDTYRAEPWRVAYSIDDGNTWMDLDEWDQYYSDPSKKHWGQVEIMNTSTGTYDPSSGGNGSLPDAANEQRNLHIFKNDFQDAPTVSVTVGADLIGELRKKTPVGPETNPVDLSTVDIYGEANPESGRFSSNCYVVNAPGWYCFPLVYGNALDSRFTGKVNKDAYDGDEKLTGGPWFRDAKGNRIETPGILPSGANLNDYDAVVVWEDVAPGHGVIDNVSVVSGSDYPYIKFEIVRGTPGKILQDAYPGYVPDGIVPCNIMIALREKNNSEFVDSFTQENGQPAPGILWSWHIWVTPSDFLKDNLNGINGNYDFGIQSLKYENPTKTPTTQTARMLNCILGWTPPLYYYGGLVEPTYREVLIRFYIPDPDAADHPAAYPLAQKTVRVIQDSAPTTDFNGGKVPCGTFYQWGRKDPLLPGRYVPEMNQKVNRNWMSPGNYNITVGANSLTYSPYIVGKETQYPYISSSERYKRHRSDGSQIINIHESSPRTNPVPYWNIYGDIVEGESNDAKYQTIKTIYDPCPPRFCVPFYALFEPLICNASTDENPTIGDSAQDGWRFDANGSGIHYLLFPYTGWRSNGEGGSFDYEPNPALETDSSKGEGPWVSSLVYERTVTSGEINMNWFSKVYHFRMTGQKTDYSQNHLSRGNVIRPIIEEVPSGN